MTSKDVENKGGVCPLGGGAGRGDGGKNLLPAKHDANGDVSPAWGALLYHHTPHLIRACRFA